MSCSSGWPAGREADDRNTEAESTQGCRIDVGRLNEGAGGVAVNGRA